MNALSVNANLNNLFFDKTSRYNALSAEQAMYRNECQFLDSRAVERRELRAAVWVHQDRAVQVVRQHHALPATRERDLEEWKNWFWELEVVSWL